MSNRQSHTLSWRSEDHPKLATVDATLLAYDQMVSGTQAAVSWWLNHHEPAVFWKPVAPQQVRPMIKAMKAAVSQAHTHREPKLLARHVVVPNLATEVDFLDLFPLFANDPEVGNAVRHEVLLTPAVPVVR